MNIRKTLGLMGLAAVISAAGYVGYKQSAEALEERDFYQNYLENCAKTPNLKIGNNAPEIKAQSVNGKGKVDLSDLEDKVVLLDFWATWCGPCRQLTPEIEKLHQEYKDKGLQIISIATMERSEKDLEKYLQNHHYDFPVVFDQDKSLKQAYAVSGIPRLVLIRNGKVESIAEGMGASSSNLIKRVRKYLDNQKE